MNYALELLPVLPYKKKKKKKQWFQIISAVGLSGKLIPIYITYNAPYTPPLIITANNGLNKSECIHVYIYIYSEPTTGEMVASFRFIYPKNNVLEKYARRTGARGACGVRCRQGLEKRRPNVVAIFRMQKYIVLLRGYGRKIASSDSGI